MFFDQHEGLVFLHPMKTGGTSVSSFVRRAVREHITPDAKMHHFHHMTPDEIMWKCDYPEDWFARNYVVMFVRNPFDRIVSFYHHMRQIGGHAQGICKRKTFREFALDIDLRIIMRPMVDYLYRQGSDVVDFLGRYENIDSEIERLIEVIGFPNKEDVQSEWLMQDHKMKTEHELYKCYYDPDTVEAVWKKYKSDFEAFGYQRGE